jgi:hypothetical protein
MAVVLVSGDLMGASRIEGAARFARIDFRMLSNADSAVEFCAATRVPLVMIDLTLAGLDLESLVSRLKNLPNGGPTIVAYGPHVHEAKLAAAQAAGCDAVMSRGQFLSNVDAILTQHAEN